MNKADCFLLGHVVKPIGTAGQVLVYLDTDNPQLYKKTESVWLEHFNQPLIPFFIKSISISGQEARILFEDCTTPEAAEELINCHIFLPLTALPPLAADKFYFHELIGYTIVDEHLGEIGEITNYYELPQQVVFSLNYKDKEALIPYHEDFYRSVDKAARKIYFSLPEGLLDVYTD